MEPDKKEVEKINSMSQYDMCKMVRFGPAGHPYTDKTKPYWEIFNKRLLDLGGFTPEISKKLGW